MSAYSPTIDELTVLAKHWAARRLKSHFRAFVNRSADGIDFATAQRHLDVLERALGYKSLAQVVTSVESELRADIGELVWTMFQNHLKHESKQSAKEQPTNTEDSQVQPDWEELRRRFEGPYYNACE